MCRRDKHVVVFCRAWICPTRNAGDWDADVVEAGRIVLADTVKCRDCYFELYSLMQNNVQISGKWTKSKPKVDFQYGGRLFLKNGSSYISAIN